MRRERERDETGKDNEGERSGENMRGEQRGGESWRDRDGTVKEEIEKRRERDRKRI